MPHITETLALVTVLGLGAQWLGWRLRIPAIVLLTLCGLLLGPVLGIVRPGEILGEAFQPLIKLGVAAILFEGGLSLRHNWTRGMCQYGVMPANGLLYTPPHPCACYNASKLNGFFAYSSR